MNKTLCSISVFTLIASISSTGSSQGLPTSQPGLLTIVREEVKLGRAADHSKFEAGWPAAYEKAKSPDYYLAMVSMTGPNEAWYVTPYASHAAIGEGMKRDNANAVLSAELARLSKGDAEYISGVRTIQALGRPDLSYGGFPDLTKARFWEITTFRVRPGQDQSFEAAAKAYASAAKRVAPQTSFRTYQVIAGMVGPTYIVFSTVNSYAEFDQMGEQGQKTMAGVTPEEGAALDKAGREALISVESNRFRLDPVQSYVSAEVKATDAAFWMPKKAVAKPASGQE